MTGLASAIRLRRRQLDTLAATLAAEQAALHALAGQADQLVRQREAERQLAAIVAFPCDPWFAEGKRQLSSLDEAHAAGAARLAQLRAEAVQCQARLQLLEDAAAEAKRAKGRRQEARAAAALDERIAAVWCRR
nr:hypothetical protein [uncultured Sphingomonas sp.]